MSETTVLDELLDPFARCLGLDCATAHRIAEFRIAPAVQDRVELLAGRANEGTLTSGERAEYEALIQAADFISLLKRKAGRRSDSNAGQ